MLELETAPATPQATAVPTTAVAEKTTTAAAAAKKAEVGVHDFGENLCTCPNISFPVIGTLHARNLDFLRSQMARGPTSSHLP
jgi:hypothetical protein